MRSASRFSRLAGVLELLVEDAYDVRIPMMVSAYFTEMADVIARIGEVSSAQTTVAIDLGDLLRKRLGAYG